jgi:RNA polymerase sigma-70 factor (ECF subfamily)
MTTTLAMCPAMGSLSSPVIFGATRRPIASESRSGQLHSRNTLAKVAAVAESDHELMQRIGQGDRDACQLLVERHLNRILAFAERTLGNHSEAEEVAQEVFTRVWLHAARWKRTEALVTTWLFRVTMNLCLNRIAKHRETTLEGRAEPASAGPQPSAEIAEKELSWHVNRALQELPEKQRIAINLCHYEGWKNSEAAEIMDLSLEAVESLLARGRRGLKKKLSAIGPDLLRGET